MLGQLPLSAFAPGADHVVRLSAGVGDHLTGPPARNAFMRLGLFFRSSHGPHRSG